jgi:uncharacterized protein CbrC (UPF0167 family)
MNFNKEIKQTHDEIQKLHDQYSEFNMTLSQKLDDITTHLKTDDCEKQYKFDVVVHHIHNNCQTNPNILLTTIILMQLGLIGILWYKK